MSDEIIQLVSSQGIWSLLSFLLIYYIVKTQEKRDEKQDAREKNYQILVSQLTEKFNIIHSDLNDLKAYLIKNKELIWISNKLFIFY